MIRIHPDIETISRPQRTIVRPVEFSGIGIHTGKQVTLRFCPAEEDTGIVFERIDLPGRPKIPASLPFVCDTTRSTTIGQGGVFVHTIEHVLAAVKAYEIDNLLIQVSDKEPPIGSGSSDVFVEMIESSGIKEQQRSCPIVKVKQPIYWSRGQLNLIALPYDGFRVSYTLHYPESKALQNQFYSASIDAKTFKEEIAPCRTFSRYEEIEYLIDRGLIKGGSLANTIVVKGDVVFSKEGLFFTNEPARHKVLDLIGDISLIGFSLHAHIVASRTGHEANYLFAKELHKTLTLENK